MMRTATCVQCGTKVEVDFDNRPAAEPIICPDKDCKNYCYYIDPLEVPTTTKTKNKNIVDKTKKVWKVGSKK